MEENRSDLSPSESSEISPILSDICFKESNKNENVFPEIVSLEAKNKTSSKPKVKNDNNNNNNNNNKNNNPTNVRPKRVTRKKRKRICMPANWRGKLSPQEKISKNNKNIINGKEMNIQRKPHKGIKVKILEDGNITFDQCPYKLRSRSMRKSVGIAETEDVNTREENRTSKGVTIGKKACPLRTLGGDIASLEKGLSEVNEEQEENEEFNRHEVEEVC